MCVMFYVNTAISVFITTCVRLHHFMLGIFKRDVHHLVATIVCLLSGAEQAAYYVFLEVFHCKQLVAQRINQNNKVVDMNSKHSIKQRGPVASGAFTFFTPNKPLINCKC